MRIYLNQKIVSNINELISDPSVFQAQEFWGKKGAYDKSAINLRLFDTPFGSISLLYGPRQIGKTASLKLFLSQLQDSETLIFTDCSAILDKADLYQHLDQLISGKSTIVLDEVQSVPDWHLALRSLYSEDKLKACRIWCTGSEARYLLESGERLPGRRGAGKVIFARPWSFREYMDFFHPAEVEGYQSARIQHFNQQWLNDQKIDWQSYWKSYCWSGGIPQVVGALHKFQEIGDGIWQIYMDWLMGSWSRLRTSERSLAALARRLCETLNSRVSFETLKKGTDIQSANTVKTLLEIQEDHFSIRVLPRFDLQKLKFLPAKLKKIYPLDPFTARVWAAIGWRIRRLHQMSIPELPLDECAFLTQTYRWQESLDVSYLYSNTTKAEVDFFFDDCGFELKSNGHPTPKQQEILNQCPQAFVVRKEKLPLVAYLIGEGRT